MFHHIVCFGAGKGLKIENRMGSRLKGKPAIRADVLESDVCIYLERNVGARY